MAGVQALFKVTGGWPTGVFYTPVNLPWPVNLRSATVRQESQEQEQFKDESKE